MSESNLGTGLFLAWAADARPSQKLCRSAAAKLRRFLQNKRGGFEDGIGSVLIEGFEGNKPFDESVDERKGD
jgi:hypothetical protein